jgi:hypothetical protein
MLCCGVFLIQHGIAAMMNFIAWDCVYLLYPYPTLGLEVSICTLNGRLHLRLKGRDGLGGMTIVEKFDPVCTYPTFLDSVMRFTGDNKSWVYGLASISDTEGDGCTMFDTQDSVRFHSWQPRKRIVLDTPHNFEVAVLKINSAIIHSYLLKEI